MGGLFGGGSKKVKPPVYVGPPVATPQTDLQNADTFADAQRKRLAAAAMPATNASSASNGIDSTQTLGG